MLRLRIVPAEGPPFVHELRGESLVIGRAAGSDLALADPFLSRQHSRFFRSGERWLVEDLGSRNGTLVNGRPIHGPTEVLPGDAIQISGSTLTIVPSGGLPGAAAAPAAARGPSAPDPPALDGAGGEAGDKTVFLRRLSAADLLEQQGVGAAAAAAQGEEALRRYAERLKLLNEVHQALGGSLTLEALLELILDRVFDHLRPEQGVIFLRRPHGSDGELVRAASRALDAAQAESVELLGSRSLAREVADKGAAALVLDAQTDVRLAGAESIMISGVRSLLAAPLLEREGTLGMIVLGSKVAVRQFNEEDLELLVSVASVAALYIRNLALAEEAAERRLLAEELALARRIQLALLPQSLPEVPGWELLGGNTPSRGVSGDYFAVVTRPAGGGDAPRECVLMVADVSGKGMAASLLTASLEAFAAGPIEDGLPPEAICAKLSRLLYRRTPPEKYATAFVAALVVGTGALRYANAGHNPPLLVRADGTVEELAATGVPIALLPGAEYEAGEARLDPGDVLILYTDGIVEANDPEGEEYGSERLADLCRRHRQAACADIAAALDADLEAFVRGVPFADDRTLVMARRLPLAAETAALKLDSRS